MSQNKSNEEVTVLNGLLDKLVLERAFEQARVIAKRLAELCPNDPAALYKYGSVLARLGEPEAAAECLAKSLDLGGDRFIISAEMCLVCMIRGDLEEAIAWCRRGLELKPADPATHRRLADLLAHSGEPDKAVNVLEVLLRMPSLSPGEEKAARAELGRLYMTMGRVDEALSNFRGAAALDNNDAALWTNIGHCLSRKGEMRSALDIFRLAADLLPNPQNLYNLGDALLGVGDPGKALGPLLEALRWDPDHVLAHYDLGRAYLDLDRCKEGAEEARAALMGDPEMKTGQINLGLNATNNLGLCLMGQENYEDAVHFFKQNERQFAMTYFNLGLVLFRMKRNREAMAYFKRAAEIEPNDPECLNFLGQICTELGKLGAAEKYLRRSLELNPEYADSYYDLGNLLLKIKDKRKEARKLFERAIELKPDMKSAYYCLGCFYALENKKTKAIEYLEKAFVKGFNDKAWIEADRDFDNLRGDPRFGKLLAKHFKAGSSAAGLAAAAKKAKKSKK